MWARRAPPTTTTSYGGTVVRIEPGDSRGWDFRDDLEAMGVL